MPERRRRKPLVISRRTGGILVCLIAAVLGYGAITVIERGRMAIGAHWPAAVAAGAGASAGLMVLLAVMVAVARWRRRASRSISLAARVILTAFLLTTWAGLAIATSSGPVTSSLEVGLAAFVLPVGCLIVVLVPLVTWRKRSPGAADRYVLVATVTVRGDYWTVGWMGLGRRPGTLRAATLTDAADQAFEAASALRPGTAAAELRMMIYPGPFRRGTTFEISGEPGDLRAAEQGQPAETYHSASLEGLADSIRQARQGSRKGFRLHWIRSLVVGGAVPSSATGPEGAGV
jgi:hypothetical protein